MNETYNKRLFSGGVRRYFHEARFIWLKRQISRLAPDAKSAIELGCFDAKSLAYLPITPSKYWGLDANWEGGLTLARQNWGRHENYKFIECARPTDVDLSGQTFDVSISMETLEHLSDNDLNAYLRLLAGVTQTYTFITVPNETGLFFLVKHATKYLIGSPSESYTASELAWATLGKTDKFQRHEHKGFNYRKLLKTISDYFLVRSVIGIPFSFLPASANFTIGIVASQKTD